MPLKPISGSTTSSATATQPALDINALLNRAAVSLARSRKLVETWLPLSDAEKAAEEQKHANKNGTGNTNGEADREREELSGVVGRPERAGLGAIIASSADDPRGLSRSGGTGSGEFEKLRKQFLGRKGKDKMAPSGSGGRTMTGGGHSRGGAGTAHGGRGGNEWTGTSDRKRAADVEMRSDDEDEEEVGRTGAVKGRSNTDTNSSSKKRKNKKARHDSLQDASGTVNTPLEPDLREKITLTVQSIDTGDPPIQPHNSEPAIENADQDAKLGDDTASETQEQPRGHGRTSYLDEVLAERTKKKKKRKRNKNKTKAPEQPVNGAG